MTDQPRTPPAQPPRSVWSKPLLLGCVSLIVLSTVLLVGVSMGFILGRWTDGDNLFAQSPSFVPTVNGSGQGSRPGNGEDAEEQLYPQFDVFWESMDLLYQDYYGELPQSEDATYAAIRSVLGLLDDPNTSFMTPDEAEFFRTHIQGSFEGIGARVGWDVDADTLVITEPFENQPAWNAGLRRDDLVLAVDGESLVGSNLADSVQKVRGPKGTAITLTILREGTPEAFDIEVARDRIEIPTITTDTLGTEQDIAYIRLNSFNENAGQLVSQAVEDAMEREPSALIFDLRGNSGGLLREAVKVTSVFLEDEVVLLQRFSDGQTETYETSGQALVKDLPVVVLVNGGSASASEIVAGALQDAQRATLIGETTFGKGSVQLPHSLSNGAIMRVTIARWYTPLDRSIDGEGLEPDIVVNIEDEARELADDPQLDAAIEHLSEQLEESGQ